MLNKRHCPIGVFDSGLGGLTVVKELIRQLPWEDIVYFGDTARVPYGTKSRESIIQFSRENTHILLKHKVKMVVVACNSSSSYALKHLQKEFRVPVIGVIEAGAQKAVNNTVNKKVGVVATSATIASHEYTKTIKQYDRSVRVFTRACPLFVPLVEEGWMHKVLTVQIAREYLADIKKENVDTLILGCTHYPLLKNALHKVMGKKVYLVDSAKEVAQEVKRLLIRSDQHRVCKRKPKYRFLISDQPQAFKKIAKNFLGRELTQIEKV